MWGAIPWASNARYADVAAAVCVIAGAVIARFVVAFLLSMRRRYAFETHSTLARDRPAALEFSHQLNRYCIADPIMTFATHITPNPTRARAFWATGVGAVLAFEGVGRSLYMRWSKTGVGTTQ